MNRELLFRAVCAEVARARELNPSSDHRVLSLGEEAGEVIKAANDYREDKGTLHDVDKEIVQCMAMCVRLWEEGDPTINLPACAGNLKGV